MKCSQEMPTFLTSLTGLNLKEIQTMEEKQPNPHPEIPMTTNAGCRVEVGSRVLIQHQGVWTPGVVSVLFDKTCLVEVRNEQGGVELVEFSYALGLYVEANPVQAHGLKITGRLVMPGKAGTIQTTIITEHPGKGPPLAHRIIDGEYQVSILKKPTDHEGI
jgi:hypothetical protein